MHETDIADLGAEGKDDGLAAHRWIAVAADIMDHEIVGADVPSPQPVLKTKHAWAPMIVWIWMLTEAAWKPKKRFIKGHCIRLQRGQLIASERFIAENANWGRKAVRVFLERLEQMGMIARCSARDVDQLRLNFVGQTLNGIQKGPAIAVITICNYEKFQTPKVARGPAGAQQGPSRGPAGAQSVPSIPRVQEEEGKVLTFPSGLSEEEADKKITMVDGQIRLFNGLRTFWLEKFNGDEQALELALLEAVPFIQVNGLHSLEAKVSGQLARQVNMAKRYSSKTPAAGGGYRKSVAANAKIEATKRAREILNKERTS